MIIIITILSFTKVRKARLLQELHLPLLMLAQIHQSQTVSFWFNCIGITFMLYLLWVCSICIGITEHSIYASIALFASISQHAFPLRVATQLQWKENSNEAQSHWGWPPGTPADCPAMSILSWSLNFANFLDFPPNSTRILSLEFLGSDAKPITFAICLETALVIFYKSWFYHKKFNILLIYSHFLRNFVVAIFAEAKYVVVFSSGKETQK